MNFVVVEVWIGLMDTESGSFPFNFNRTNYQRTLPTKIVLTLLWPVLPSSMVPIVQISVRALKRR
jgi:hypothetical protein